MNGSRAAIVTGGGGFLGSRIISLLLAEGWRVKSFSRRSYPELTAQGVTCHVGDLADAETVRAAFKDMDLAIHAAAKTAIWGRYSDYHATNVTGTRNVIDACRSNKVRKLVYTSSPSVIFDGSDVHNANETAPLAVNFLAHYPRTKAEAERLVLAANGSELSTVALRPHLIWGPGDTQFLPRLVERHRAKRLMLVGSGENLVDTTFVDNAARAHLDAANRLAPGSSVAGRAYFISQGDPRPIRSMINGLLQAAGMPPVKRSIPAGPAYAAAWLVETAYRMAGRVSEPPLTRFLVQQMSRAHYFDISAARCDIGYAPTVTIEEGMRRLEAWIAKGARWSLDI